MENTPQAWTFPRGKRSAAPDLAALSPRTRACVSTTPASGHPAPYGSNGTAISASASLKRLVKAMLRGSQPHVDSGTDVAARLELYRRLLFYKRLMLEQLLLPLDLIPTDSLHRLEAADTEDALMRALYAACASVTGGLAHSPAPFAQNAAGAAAFTLQRGTPGAATTPQRATEPTTPQRAPRSGGGGSSGGSRLEAAPDAAAAAAADVAALWVDMQHSGMVSVDANAGGRITYHPHAPQKPPYRTLHARLVLGPKASDESPPPRWHGGGRGNGRALVTGLGLEIACEASYLMRHPEVAAHDRLLRLDCAEQEFTSEALVMLLERGITVAGRQYQLLCCKDDKLWLLATQSVGYDDAAAWKPVRNAFKEVWPLLGAAVLLPTVQAMFTRSELWSSKAVPLALQGWNISIKPDPTVPDPSGGDDIKLTDGAGRASTDLWDLITGAWQAHRDAAAAVTSGPLAHALHQDKALLTRGGGRGGGAAAAAGTAVPYRRPVQMRLHAVLLEDKPRVVAKGMLSPDARLPPRTIELPYSCVKAPARPELEQWLGKQAQIDEEVRFCMEADWEDEDVPQQPAPARQAGGSGGVHGRGSGGGGSSGSGGGGSSGSNRQGEWEPPVGPCCRRGYTANIQLELLTEGHRVHDSRANRHLLPLLVHLGLDRAVVMRLVDAALEQVETATRTPEDAKAALKGFEGRGFDVLRQRLGVGWGYTSPKLWEKCDAHLLQELRDLRAAHLNGLKEFQLPLPDSHMAVGVPDHTASLGRRQVVLMDNEGRSVASTPTRCLLYRDPDLKPCGVLAAWLVPPPPGLMEGFGPRVASALIMSITGGESLAALMAGGDFDGDLFHLMTHPDAVDACWPRAAAAQDVPLECAQPWQQQQQRAGSSAGSNINSSGGGGGNSGSGGGGNSGGGGGNSGSGGGGNCGSGAGGSFVIGSSGSGSSTNAPGRGAGGVPGGGGAGSGAAAAAAPTRGPGGFTLSYPRALERGQLWLLPPQIDSDDPAELTVQLLQFFVHAQKCQLAIGSFQHAWAKCLELPQAEGGGVGGRWCKEAAEGYDKALDAKKHATQPALSKELEAVCRLLPDPEWHRKNWRCRGGGGKQARAAGPRRRGTSILTDMYERLLAFEAGGRADALVSAAGSGGGDGAADAAAASSAALHVDEGVLAFARKVVPDDGAWDRLCDMCLDVVKREWSVRWSSHIGREEAEGMGGTSREACRRRDAANNRFSMNLLRGLRRALLEGARPLLQGRLQMGEFVCEPLEPVARPCTPGGGGGEGLMDLRASAALAGALYRAVYNNTEQRVWADSKTALRLRAVWLAAGTELNVCFHVVHTGSLLGLLR